MFVGTLAAKALGAVYRIPLTWVLGAEGLGIYQLVFPIFSLLLVMSSTGMPTAISKMIARRESNVAEAHRILKVSIVSLTILGAVFGVILFAGASLIANIQGNPLATPSYMAIAPAVVLVSILSAFRGYFQGRLNMVPTAVSGIVEQFFKLIFGLAISYLLVPYGIEYGVLGAILGVSLSEVMAVLYMLVCFLREKKREVVPAAVTVIPARKLLKELWKTAAPIIVASIIIPLSLVLDSLLVVNLLNGAGFSVMQSTVMWGIDSGVVTSIINLPVVLTLSVAVAVVPSIVRDAANSHSRIRSGMLLALNISIPCALGIALLSPHIISALYGTSLGMAGAINEVRLATQLLTLSSFLVVLTSVLQTQNASLQALGRSRIPVINMSIALVVKVGCMLLLVSNPGINVFGLMLAKYVFFGIVVLANAVYLFKRVKVRMRLGAELFAMVGASVTMVLALMVFMNFELGWSVWIMLPLEIVLGVGVYLGSLMCLAPQIFAQIPSKSRKAGL